jgi:uncharacterized protein
MKGRDRKILEKSRPPVSLMDFDRESLVRLLKRKLSVHENVRQAFLFGSAVTGEIHPWSDVDLVIVAETSEPFIERPRQFFDLLDIGIPVDVLVYTPAEFKEMRKSSSGFWKCFREAHVELV